MVGYGGGVFEMKHRAFIGMNGFKPDVLQLDIF